MIEQDVIQKIVADVSTKLNRATDLYVAHYPVGLDDQIERIDPLLGIEKGDEVRMIGIYGAEGIGKSTIAKAIFNSYRHRFQASSFLANVKATSAKGKLHKVQKTLLSETLWDDRTGPANPSKGANTIGRRLRSKKVLIVIDDVDDLEELRQLAGDQEWFGYGSRIIITTQNEDLLRAHRVRHLYEAKRLDDLYSCQLFCWNAFRRLEPPNPFTKLCRRVLDLIQGIPQALILIGSHLYGRSEAEWETLIVKLEKMSSGGGWDRVLEFAIDGLEKLQRALFLIIACFLNGRSKDVVMRICEISDSIFDVRMEELSDKSMVTVEKNVVWVREPLRGAAKNVLRARSRLKYLVVKLLTELDEATDELGNNIEEAVRNLFHEVFEDSESEEDEEDALVDVADAIGSAAQTVIRGGEAALEEVTYGISSMFEGFSSFFE
ncbi:hypothetical protein SAY86_023929 [Trapa natans]|uniref:AAA+ ATPase domain-containing protein n=1 Tax=Trapa natans TaxID=22666 RepID=A0AAN7LWK4_TRANT|nr:hypothetical protein SAY86_023929 [Trapa natans]